MITLAYPWPFVIIRGIRGCNIPPFHRCFPIVPSKWTKWTSKWTDYFSYFSNFFIIFARKKNLMA